MKRLIRVWQYRIKTAIFKALGLEGCMVCRFGVAQHNNEITLRGHIGVIGLRCNRCQHQHDIRLFRAELMA